MLFRSDSEKMARGKLANKDLFLMSDAQSSVSVLQSNGFITSGDENTKKNRVETGNTSNIGDNITNISTIREAREIDR